MHMVRKSAAGCAATIAAGAAASATVTLSKRNTAGKGKRQDSNCHFVHNFVPFKFF